MIVKKDYIFEQYQKYRFKWMPNCAPCLFYNLAFIEAFYGFYLFTMRIIKILFMALESIINPYEEHVIIDPHYLKDRVVIARNYNQYKRGCAS